MIRLGVSVEGATEREFVSQVLAPFLVELDIHAIPIDMRGNVSLPRIQRELRTLVHNFDHVTTLYDYYGFKQRGDMSVDDLEAQILGCVSAEKQGFLIPYVQLHEFEALVMACPGEAELMLGVVGLSARIIEILTASGGAEAVNDGVETCPSRRMKGEAEKYDKKLHGPTIIKSAGIAKVREACPRFDAWVNRLEQLNNPAGVVGNG